MDRKKNIYHQLLNSTTQHLEDLKSRGIAYLPISTHSLKNLSRTPSGSQSQPAFSLSEKSSRGHTPASEKNATSPVVAAQAIRPRHAPDFPAKQPEQNQTADLPEKTRDEKIAALRVKALSCRKCPNLVRARKNVVFGVGDIHADLMFIGEAPGADEDRMGEPFVGKAGQILTKIIGAMGFSRQTVYIANVLKCRPDTPDKPYGNRKPTQEEMHTCLPYLNAQIDLIQPKVVVALGATALQGLLGTTSGISRLRGKFQDFKSISLMPTFHPSYVLRAESNPTEAAVIKRQVWEDMLQVMEHLNCPISAKQRGYFLPKNN
ncbi:MAG TPA: uracil-DNA glycosylase [Verrucomicrobia bacterium]|nr:uracil-DNA glycosylase [Verrucomicrobiota bacterium]